MVKKSLTILPTNQLLQQEKIKKQELQAKEEAFTYELSQKEQKLTEQTQTITNLTQQIKELNLTLIQLEQTKATELKDFKALVKEKLTQIKATHQKIVSVFEPKD